MTKSIADLHLEMVGDIQKCFLAFLQKQVPEADFSQELSEWVISVLLPLHIDLRQSPSNKVFSSAKKNQSFYLSFQHAQFIETYTIDNQFSKEDALIELITLSLLPHKNLRTITRQVRGKSAKDIQVMLDIKLVGPMKWHEKRTDNAAA